MKKRKIMMKKKLHLKGDKNPILRQSKVPCLKPRKPVPDPKNQKIEKSKKSKFWPNFGPGPHRMVPGPWSLVPWSLVPWSLVPGPWSLVPGPWSLVPGPMVPGPWSHGPWSLVPGPWPLVPGPWSLVHGLVSLQPTPNPTTITETPSDG